MNERTKRGLEVLEAALLLGLLGDALLRAMPWGLNVTLWMSALALALVALLARGRRKALLEEGRWLVLPLIFFSAGFAWRDSLTLKTLDALALLITLSLIALRARGGRIRLGGMMEYALGACIAGFNAFFGAFPLVFRDIGWKEIPRAGWTRQAIAIVRGLLITVPLLLVFGALLMAADAVFEGLINTTFQLDFSTLFSHLMLLSFLSWVTAGFLRSALMGREVPRKEDGRLDISKLVRPLTGTLPPTLTGAQPSGPEAATKTTVEQSVSAAQSTAIASVKKNLSLGIVEIGIVLGTLNLLFFLFVAVQVRYFFGGAALVRVSAMMTYAEYARRGFFELVCVAALVLPLLLSAHWLLRKENPSHERIFRLLAGIQVALLFVIMTSAIARMRLYQSEYGLTELRLYTTAFMGWLALVFIWFAATVLRGQRERFACGALVTGFLMIGALHVMNPDALIVRANVAHIQAGRDLDATYAVTLSADAVPALVEALPLLDRNERRIIAIQLLNQRVSFDNADWRTWNWSRSEAASVLQEEFDTVWQASYMAEGNWADVR
jgi:hypothetical protein